MEKVADIAEKLRPVFEAHQVVLAYLFGSAAREEHGPLSDIDVAVVFARSVSRAEYFDRELKLAGDISRALGEDRVDVVNLATVQNPVLKYGASLEGLSIYVKSPRLKSLIERTALREYENTNYLRRVARQIMYRQIKDGTFGRPRHHVRVG